MIQPTIKVGAIQPLICFPSSGLLFTWAAFVVYGSLVPLDFHAVGLDNVALDFLGLGHPGVKLRSLTDWITNIAIFVPLGFLGLATILRSQGVADAIWSAIVTLGGCIVLSLGIEFTQVFVPPRDSSILDVIANGIGAALGIGGWFALGNGITAAYRAVVKMQQVPHPVSLSGKVGAVTLFGSGLLIAAWGGLFTFSWTGWDVAIAHFQGTRLLPFLQHQEAEIGLALASTMFAVLAYAPLGAVLWLRDICHAKPLRLQLLVTTVVATSVALLVEVAKLFLVARNPDTGNIVIAGIAAVLGYFISPLAVNLITRHDVDAVVANGTQTLIPSATASTSLVAGRVIALTCGIAACTLVATYPMGQIQLGVALLVYGAVLVRYPTVWLLVIPALLPVLDLAPWTGRFFFDEFDGFVLVTLAVGLWRAAGQPLMASAGRVFWLMVAGFTASFLVSSVIGLLPLQPLDANALTSHYSHYAALRLAKGLVFAIGLGALISSHVAAEHHVKRVLGAGVILGLASAVGSVIWERGAYAGLTDFAKGFRVVGLFSTMHTGGAHLDAFLVVALPFAAVWALRSRQTAGRLGAAMLFIGGTYGIMMTFSRAAVAALFIEVMIIAAWAFLSNRRMHGHAMNTWLKVAAGLALAGMVIAPVLLGSFMQSRMATTSADLETRTSHWNDAIDIMTNEWSTALLGMGLGRYPETYLLLSREDNKPATHRLETEAGNTYLRIRQGSPLYVEQIVKVEPMRNYRVVLKARTRGHNAAINALLCDRTFLQGFDCQSVTFQMAGGAGNWQQFQATLNSSTLGENRLRVTKFSLENASSESPIDIDDVALIDSDGRDHLANGRFQAGADRWFFSTPYNHLPWHIKNLWLEIFFEQGWLGLLTFCGLITVTVARLAWLAWQGKSFAAVLLAGLVGFLAVGAFDSLFDAPRLTLMFGLLIAASGIIHAQQQELTTTLGLTGAASKPPDVKLSATLAPGIPPRLEWRKTALNVVMGVVVLAVFIVLVTQMPFVPYRVRELPNRYHPILAPILLAAFVFWVFGMPAIAARWLTVAKSHALAYPLLVGAHGLIGWAMIQFAVLPDSIHTVTGSPILNWPWRTEDIARFVPLLSVLSVQLTGGALIAAAIAGSRLAAAPVWWIVSATLLFPVQYWAIVTQAATDNLTELMASSASFGAFLLLSAYLILIGITGSLLASLRGSASPTRTSLVLASLVLSLPLGYLLLTTGTESVIVKGQKAYSAFQSLLSTDRAHYAVGPELWIRFGVAHFVAVCATGLSQRPLWVGFQRRSPRRRRRKLP